MPAATVPGSAVQILYSSEMLRDAIRRVLEDPDPGDRRVAIVAFIGGQAESFLPNPDGLQLVCALQAGATDGVTLSRLKARKAALFKSDRLHMKVYWSSRNGCVICSANASGNALGGGDQKEAGAWFPAGTVNIDRLWTYANPQPLEDGDLERFVNNPERMNLGLNSAAEARPPDFLEWMTLAGHKKWKLGWYYEDNYALAQVARNRAQASYGITDPYDFIVAAKGQASRGDWFLTFELPDGKNLQWMCIDFVIKVPKSDEQAYEVGYPYQGVQLYDLTSYPSPPFVIDENFQRAFESAVSAYASAKIEGQRSLAPTKRLLSLIETNWPI